MGSPSNKASYHCWEEVFVSSDIGRREVHYYLKRRDGVADLAVIGKEKSLRRMSYRYVVKGSRSGLCKLKSRREVVDWLNSNVSESSCGQKCPPGDFFNLKDSGKINDEGFKDTQSRKLGQCTKEFSWLGSPWMCRKRRKHYQSFHRNGVKISIHDFVYVLAEEDKRLVAYLEDMYEDSRGNKMVVVRWFHKIDEVAIVLPHNSNDREIFFSLCLQDLSIECIDGMATVLSPQHYEKFLNEATHTWLEPFVCHKQFDNEDVKPFDITQVKGYWDQALLRFMFNDSTSKNCASLRQPDDGLKAEETTSDHGVGSRPKKRHRRSKDNDPSLQCSAGKGFSHGACADEQNWDCDSGPEYLKAGASGALPYRKEAKHSFLHYLKIGSQVEVLSQDSGLRGCWLRALIIKKHKDKVKVQYQDIQDADDEANKLEEWILASRVAVLDQLGFRISGRTMIRPPPESNEGQVQWVFDVGSVVDAWWHDGWWEGIVVQKEDGGKFHVYFPGEKQQSIFPCDDLRHSQEWLGNRWIYIKERLDLVDSILSDLEENRFESKSCDGSAAQVATLDGRQSRKDEAGCGDSYMDSGTNKAEHPQAVPDLLGDGLLSQLKWKTTRKRKRGSRNSVHKLLSNNKNSKRIREVMKSSACERFLIPTSLKVDHENCKYVGDSIFNSSVVPLTSLVMSR